jgi:hypothetical protein
MTRTDAVKMILRNAMLWRLSKKDTRAVIDIILGITVL